MTHQGIIVLYHQFKKWGFIQEADGKQVFFHLSNSTNFQPSLGLLVAYETGPALRLGQPDQAIRLRAVNITSTESGAGGGK